MLVELRSWNFLGPLWTHFHWMTTLIESRSPKKRVAKIRIGKWQRSHNVFLLQIHLKSHLGISDNNFIDIHAHFVIYKTKTLVHNEVPSLDKKYISTLLCSMKLAFNEFFFLIQPNQIIVISDYKIFSLLKQLTM